MIHFKTIRVVESLPKWNPAINPDYSAHKTYILPVFSKHDNND